MKKKVVSIILVAMMAVTPMSVSAQEIFTSGSTLTVETSAELETGTSSGEKKYQGFTYIEENGVIVITHYNGNAKDVKIPETINGKKVLYVRGMNAFSSPKKGKKVAAKNYTVNILIIKKQELPQLNGRTSRMSKTKTVVVK